MRTPLPAARVPGEESLAPRPDRFRPEVDAAAPIAQQEAAGFVTLSTTSFAGLAAALTLASVFWPDSRLQRSAPLLAVATAVLVGLAVAPGCGRPACAPPRTWSG